MSAQPQQLATRGAMHRQASTGLFLLAAAASFGLSVTLWFSGNESEGIFVGIWVPSILSLGALLQPQRSRT